MGKVNRGYQTTYWLKRPDKSRRSFSIALRKVNADGDAVEHGTFTDDRVPSLNEAFRSGTITETSCEAEFINILLELNEREMQLRGSLPIDAENEKVFKQYWELKYATKRNKDLSSAKNETIRSIQSVGNLPLRSASAGDIQHAVDSFSDGDANKQRRLVSRLKSILKTIGRYDTALSLSRDDEEIYERKFITYRDLPLLISHIRSQGLKTIAGVSVETYIALIQFIFWSGLRIGEVMAIEIRYFNRVRRSLDVEWQLDERGRRRKTKNKKKRKTMVPLQGKQFVDEWVQAPDRMKLNRKEATKKLKTFCIEIFKDPQNHITLHGLRTSYVCMMLRHYQFSINDVADYIGDNVVTAKKHYAGFIPDDIALEHAAQKTAAPLK